MMASDQFIKYYQLLKRMTSQLQSDMQSELSEGKKIKMTGTGRQYEKTIFDGQERSRENFSDTGAEGRRASLCENTIYQFR